MSTVQNGKYLSVFFDCRRGGGEEKGYEALHHVTYEQCCQLVSLASLHGTQSSQLYVGFHLVFQTHIETFQHPLSALAGAVYHPWLTVIERMMSETDQPSEFGGRTARSAFVNKMAVVRNFIQDVLLDAPHRHLVLFCSTYVSPAEAMQSLADLPAGSLSQQICCVLPDWAAVCVTAARIRGHLRLYRCPFSPTQLQCALQDALGPHLLPGVPAVRRLTLRLECKDLSCKATVMHYADSIRRYSSFNDFRLTREALSSGYTTETVAQCSPVWCWRDEAAAQGTEDGPCLLELRGVLQADKVDEAMLFGDTWKLMWDGDCGPTSALDTYTSFHTFRDAFKNDILVFSGDAKGMLSSCHSGMRYHHYVLYGCADTTMRLREIVPTELRFVPLMPPPPCGGGSRPHEDVALQVQLKSLRLKLVAQSASAEFSLSNILRADVCTKAREAHPITVREPSLIRHSTSRSA